MGDSPGSGTIEPNRENANDGEANLPPPLLYVRSLRWKSLDAFLAQEESAQTTQVDVNIAPGQPPERIVLREACAVLLRIACNVSLAWSYAVLQRSLMESFEAGTDAHRHRARV